MKSDELKVFSPGVEGRELFTKIRGYQEAQFIYQAFSSGIFEHLTDRPKSSLTISKELDYQPERGVFFLDALVSINLAKKEGENYCISSLAATYLCQKSRFYMGDLFNMEFSIKQSSVWGMLESWLKGNQTESGHNPKEVFKPSFIKAMAQGVLYDDSIIQTADFISKHSCFSKAENLLDVGGGHGLFSLALQKKKPDLKITVFDLPQAEEIAKEYAEAYGGQINFCSGNFYQDQFPDNQDIILAFDILHPVPTVQKEEVFKKVHYALKKGGYLFHKLWFLDETRTKPSRAALFALKCKITNSQSHVYTLEEARVMLTKLGFAVEDKFLLGDNSSTILVAKKKD